MTVILGPCPCSVCHVLLWWVRDAFGCRWMDRHGIEHDCELAA